VRFAAIGGAAALRLRLETAGERLLDTVRHELDAGLALPGLVVVFACGIAVYHGLASEPWLPALIAASLVATVITAIRRRRGHAARIAATLTALVLGATAAAIETARVAAPRLDHERNVTVDGRVVDLDATARGGLRMTVDVTRMEGRGLTPATTPTRITATTSTHGFRPDVGDGVRFKARLKPPEGPVMPGGYDFARRAWFEGRGAGGYVLGRVERANLGPAGWSDRLLAPVGSLRHAIAERVRAELPGATGTIGAALMVGEQRAIPDAVNEPLRASGLTHIVSISGLHMSLVAGGVIVAIRGLLALFPMLALGFPIKKWAACVAFVAATIYLLLSGNQVAALRSHLMLSVALFAVMVDRPAITMHTVAVSAALILAIEPSAAMEPSFQMSYLAVIALVAAYDLYRSWSAGRPPPAKEASLAVHLLGAGLRQAEGFAFSSLVAGLATAPVIAAVFFRAAPYSILANMAVLPVTGLVIMPAAVVAALAMPFGLEHWPLLVMGLGIDWMIAVGSWAAALPAGAGYVGAPHAATLPLGILAVLWLSAWKSRIRLLGVLPAIAALALVFAGPRPDVMIGRHGTLVAVRGDDGRLAVLGTKQEQFDTAIWLAADRDPRPPSVTALGEGWSCDGLGCIYRRTRDGGRGTERPSDPAGVPPAALLRAPGSVESVGHETGRGQTGATPRSSGAPVSSRPLVSGPAESARDAARQGPTGGFPAAPGSVSARPRDSAAMSAEVTSPGSAARRAVAEPGEEPIALEVAVVRHPAAFAEDCRRAAVVVTTLIAPPGCRERTTVVDRLDLARMGATTLDFIGPAIRSDVADVHRLAGRREGGRGDDVPERKGGRETDRGQGAAARDGIDGPRTAAGLGTGRGPSGRDSGRPPPAVDPTRDGDVAPVEAETASTRADPTAADLADADRGLPDAAVADVDHGLPDTAVADASFDPPTLWRAVRITTSLPARARPWTPRDPRNERLVRDAARADDLAYGRAEETMAVQPPRITPARAGPPKDTGGPAQTAGPPPSTTSDAPTVPAAGRAGQTPSSAVADEPGRSDEPMPVGPQ